MSNRSTVRLLGACFAMVFVVPVFSQDATPWVTRFNAKHIFSEGVGHDRGLTTLEWFLPLEQDSETEMWFGDFRAIMFDDAEFGGNLGLGYRHYHADHDRIYGINAYWDFRDESSLLFNQAGLGLETLGQVFDFRLNGYIPTVNDASQRLPFTFSGHHLIENEYHALSGFDYEAAVNLPDWGPLQTRVAGGGYFFDSSNTDAANGWRARLEVAFKDSIAASVAVQDDDVFGQTVNFMVEIRRTIEHTSRLARRSMHHKFRNSDGAGNGQSVVHRLADPVYRQSNIVLHRTATSVADNSGTPLNFLHVVEGGGGDGTFEMPFGSITDAMMDPDAATSVVYTPEGGTFTESVTLVAGTRVLSNGPLQTVTSSIGDVQLPFSGAGADLSALPASIFGDVILANDTELSGFDITGQVSGTGVMTANVNQTAISSAPGDALSFTNSDDITIDGLAISTPAGHGILLSDTTATLSNATITNAGDDGIQIDNAATSRAVTASNVTITDAANEGVDVNVAGAGDLTLAFSNSSVSSTNNAFDVSATAAGDALINADELTLASASAAGFNADGSAGTGTLTINSFANNTVTNAMTGGVLFNTVTFDADSMTAGDQSVSSGALTVGSSGTRVQGVGVSLLDASGDWNAGVLSIFNNNDTGLVANNSALGTPLILASETGSVINSLTGAAIELNTITANELTFDSITSTDSTTRGLGFTTVTGDLISGTTTLADSALPAIRYETITGADVFRPNLGETIIESTISAVPADNIEEVGLTDGVLPTYTPLTINFP